MNNIIIDNNIFYLKELTKHGFTTVFCDGNTTFDDILKDISKLRINYINNIFININLMTKSYSKKQSYGGFHTFKRLSCHILSENWNLLSFENNTTLNEKIKELINYDIQIVDYINFLKQ